MEKVDIAIIGAGVIGLAIAYVLSDKKKEIIVIEKNLSFGQEASSRNSEVIHSGIYYPKGSLKAETCIRGKELIYDLCGRRGIPHKKLGKLIVAGDKKEIGKLDDLYRNAGDCGVKGLKFLDEKEIKKLEPAVKAERALFSPDSGILDTHALMKFFFTFAGQRGADFSFGVEVVAIEKSNSSYKVTVKEPQGDIFSFETGAVINCAGIDSDKVAAFAGIDPDKCGYRIHYSKGQYFRVKNPEKFSVKHLIYPPPPVKKVAADMLRGTSPQLNMTDLGIHVTPDLAGGLRLGPDAKYVTKTDYNVDENERDNFRKSLARFLPDIEIDDLIPDTAGIRAKLQKEDGDFRDFVIQDEGEKGLPNFINLIGIESPGLTGSLAIAERVKSCLNIR